MIEKIIFIFEIRVTLRDYKRFGIETLQENGFRVEMWDLSPILHPKLFENYIPPDAFRGAELSTFNNEARLYDALSKLSTADFVINFVTYNFRNLRIYKAISKSKADYAVSYVNAQPTPVIKRHGFDQAIAMLRRAAGFRYPKSRQQLFMKLPPQWLGIKPAALILSGGANSFNHNGPVDKNTQILRIHALDYDLYLQEKDKPRVEEEPFAVFIDSFFPFHPDQIVVKEKNLINPDRYYRLLNDFFDLVEEKSGLEIVIAAHPRSYYERLPDYYRGRKCIRGRTANLIKESRFVISQASTAVNIANLFYKPVIFITSSDFEKLWEIHTIREMSKWFGKRPIFIDRGENLDLEKELIVNRELYDKYRSAYIKTPDSAELPFGQIVANRLKKGPSLQTCKIIEARGDFQSRKTMENRRKYVHIQ